MIKKNTQAGFTLIEIMVAIVVIGIIVAIATPNYLASQNNARVASLKVNMKTFQTVLETYAIDWQGTFAGNVSDLKAEADGIGRDYWKEFNNPFTSKVGNGISYNDVSAVTLTSTGVSNPDPALAGQVLYDPVTTDQAITRYFVYALDKSGNALTDQGQILTLSNT
ncbi:MAG: prepilin-type N-terminal cleavage/methylation domain-containing protein [Candidatus Sericytochromatia bacterium]